MGTRRRSRSTKRSTSFLLFCSLLCIGMASLIKKRNNIAVNNNNNNNNSARSIIESDLFTSSKAVPVPTRYLAEEEGTLEIEESVEKLDVEEVEEKEAGHGHHGEEEEEEEDPDHFEEVELIVVVVIALFLILATLAFEWMKDTLEESVSEDLEVILEKLFGELTILGFLAMVTFGLTQTGILQEISEHVFGEEEELIEYFEQVHFSIFFIMIGFVVQVLFLINEASGTEKFWDEMDTRARMAAHSKTGSIRQSFTATKSQREAFDTKESIWSAFFPQFRNPKKELRRQTLIFKALREEFILERSLEPSFEPAPLPQRVEEDFNFGRYLSLSQALVLSRIVEVEERTWFLFALGTCAFFGICELAGRDIEKISYIWVAIGWVVLISNIIVERHLVYVRNQFIPKRFLAKRPSSVSTKLNRQEQGETSYLVGTFYGQHSDDLPAWCDIDIDHFRQKGRSWIAKCFVGGKPNRQQALFWLDSFGPSLYFILLQSNLVFTGVYAGLLLITFYPYIFEVYHWGFGIGYVILSLMPIVGISLNKKRVVAALAQVSSVGTYRKPQIVSDVLLETKTARVVRTFLIVHKMWHTARNNLTSDPVAEPSVPAPAADDIGEESFSALERNEVSKSFDALDADGSGAISHDEFRDLLTRIGAELDDAAFMKMVNTLDTDGDGEVTKEEFLTWYGNHSAADDMTIHERAKDLFEMFDDDHSGELSIGELKSKIDALGMGFTVDEVGAIVNELDRDRSGTVSEEEFLELLEKYYPKELGNLEEDDEDSRGD